MMGASSIRSWEQLAKIFLRQFQSSLSYAPPVDTLENVKQGSEETLHDYFIRFNAKVPLVQGATDEAVKCFLINGLRRGSDFWKSLQAKEPETLVELYQYTDPFKRL